MAEKTRKFNGTKYDFIQITRSLEEAKKVVKRYREKHGRAARYVKAASIRGKPVYNIYAKY